MARNRGIDRALQTPNRGSRYATAAVLVLGLIVIVWAVSPTEQRRRGIMEELELGDPSERVVAMLGEPLARCEGGALGHLVTSFPQGWPAASAETAVQALGSRTRERWVYPLDRSESTGCAPRDGQTELGIGTEGAVLWYVAVTGKTPLRVPDEITPASPGGDAGAQ